MRSDDQKINLRWLLFALVIIPVIAGTNINDSFYFVTSYLKMTLLQVAFAQNQFHVISIPKGSASPEIDITKLSPRQWYTPDQLTLRQNDSVTWINKDTEVHTVTSGTGAGLESLINNKQGIRNGIFDSGIFSPGANWSHKFVNPGFYTYFCTVHPWMQGSLLVKKGGLVQNIPSSPVDASGQRQNVFPVHTLTKDKKYDIDLAWSPRVLMMGVPVSFILDFSDPITSKRLHLLPYDIVILQNGTELLRKPDLSEAGSDVHEITFSNPGPISIKIDNVGDKQDSSTEFNSTVYENPNFTDSGTSERQQVQLSSLPTNPFKVTTLTLVWITYTIIAVIPAAVAAVYILYRKKIL